MRYYAVISKTSEADIRRMYLFYNLREIKAIGCQFFRLPEVYSVYIYNDNYKTIYYRYKIT